MLSSVDCITTTSASEFSVHTSAEPRAVVCSVMRSIKKDRITLPHRSTSSMINPSFARASFASSKVSYRTSHTRFTSAWAVSAIS
jgi:hypothetical protein